MKVRIKANCSKSCPGDHIKREYKRGQLIRMSFEYSKYPGKPYTQGTLGWIYESRQQNSTNPVNKEWMFWSNSDIDFALIFEPKDIDQLYLSQQEYEQLPPEAINAATFKIIIEK